MRGARMLARLQLEWNRQGLAFVAILKANLDRCIDITFQSERRSPDVFFNFKQLIYTHQSARSISFFDDCVRLPLD